MSTPLVQGNEESPWWVRYGARGVGSAGGVIAIGLGIFSCIGFSSSCAIAGVLQMLAGFIVVAAEAPFCCMFIEFVEKYSKIVDGRPAWQKAAVYIGVSLPPVFICFSLATFFGSGLIFITGAMYGMMAVGKKGQREDMLTTAGSGSTANTHSTALVDDPEAWRSS